MRAHKLSKIIPDMRPDEFSALKADIENAGKIHEPIVLFEDQILDGRHRYRACKELKVEPSFWEYDGDDPVGFVWSANGARRHLTSSQLAAVAAEIADARKKPQRGGGDRKSQKSKVSTDTNDPLRAREKAASLTGASPASTARAQRIKAADPESFEKVKSGEITVSAGEKKVRDDAKRKSLIEAERSAKKSLAKDESSWDLRNIDCIKGLRELIDDQPRLIFADPPYNIGVDYYGAGEKADQIPVAKYMMWVTEWIGLSYEALASDGTFWVMISDEFAAEYSVAIKSIGFHVRSWIIWYESFGVNNAKGFNRTHRHIFYCVKNAKRFVFNETKVQRPSDRQVKYKDARAAMGGKTLDDVWFDIPRLVGTSKERLPDFPTQLPIALVQRIVECCSEPGDLVVDPFSGSGTTGAACIRTSRRFIGMENNKKAFTAATRRLKGEV